MASRLFLWVLLSGTLHLFSPTLHAQGKPEPYVGCGTILIETRQTGSTAFDNWSRFVESQGVRIDRTDPTLLLFNTLPVSIKKMNCEYFIESTVIDNGNIFVSLKWRSLTTDSTTGLPNDFQKWTYTSEKKSVSFTLYNEIMRLVDNSGYTLIWYKD